MEYCQSLEDDPHDAPGADAGLLRLHRVCDHACGISHVLVTLFSNSCQQVVTNN